jgi:uncharacterized integral membrane protein
MHAQPLVVRSTRDPRPAQAPGESRTPPRTVAGSTWVLACIAVLILIVLVVFIAQNTESVRVSLFGFHGRFPLAVALLAAVAAGCVLTLGLGTTRILQLRRIVRRHRRADLAAAEDIQAGDAEQPPVSTPATQDPPGAPVEESAGPSIPGTR